MSNRKFEIKITHEANGDRVELDNLSLQASKALVILIDALNKIAESERNSDEISISVVQGSAAVILEAPERTMTSIQRKVNDVISKNSSNTTYLESLRSIQGIIKANGLSYDADIFNGDQNIPLIQILKESKKIVSPRRARTDYFNIEFLTGRLLEIGGKKPNIHIEKAGIKTKVTCTFQQAKSVESFLYNDIMICAWSTLNPDNKKEYVFCDHYINNQLFTEFKEDIRFIMDAEGTEPLIRIHKKFKDLIVNNRLGEARKFIKLFNNNVVDKQILRAVLLATKAFKDNEQFSDIVISILEILKKKTGKEIV